MSFFADTAVQETLANETDVLGGASRILDSDAYPITISMAYGITSKGGAKGLVIEGKLSDGRDYSTTQYVTSGTAKGCKPYYEKDGEKHYLPGYQIVNSICLLAAGKELPAMVSEEKVVKIYNYDSKSEVPTKVPVLVELIGKTAVFGIIRVTENKTVKNDQTGLYQPTAETRDLNELDKVFHSDSLRTTAEIRAQSEVADFHTKWIAKNRGVTKDKTTTTGLVAGVPKAAADAKPTTSLFG